MIKRSNAETNVVAVVVNKSSVPVSIVSKDVAFHDDREHTLTSA